MLARPIYDWFLLRSLSFDFKITKVRGRKSRTVAVISDEARKRNCCNARKAILAVLIGKIVDLIQARSFINYFRSQT